MTLLCLNSTVNNSPLELFFEGESEMNIERTELVLRTIDKLGVASVHQLHRILKLGSYRYTCKVIQGLEQYLHVERMKQKIVYLNKEGRDLIGATREVRKSALLDHNLLANEVFIHYDCPVSWKREYVIEIEEKATDLGFIKVQGLNVVTKRKIVSDAAFNRNGYTYIIEIDNTRKMIDNKKKIQRYLELWPEIKRQYSNPRLCIFTKSQKRKRIFLELTKNIPNEVHTFDEL